MGSVPKASKTLPVVMLIIATIVVIADQAAKAAVLAHLSPGVPQPVVGDWARLYLTFNSGAAFSMGENHTWVFTIIQALFVVGVVWYSRRVTHRGLAIAAALIAGGAAGNLLDRLFRPPAFGVGHVVDFISIGNFAIFNIADSAITCGAALFFVLTLFGAEDKPTAEAADTAGAQAPAGAKDLSDTVAKEGDEHA